MYAIPQAVLKIAVSEVEDVATDRAGLDRPSIVAAHILQFADVIDDRICREVQQAYSIDVVIRNNVIGDLEDRRRKPVFTAFSIALPELRHCRQVRNRAARRNVRLTLEEAA